jgi:ribosome maturation factor RimP
VAWAQLGAGRVQVEFGRADTLGTDTVGSDDVADDDDADDDGGEQ